MRIGDFMPNSNGKILDKLTIKSGLHLTVIAILLIILCTYDLRWIFPSFFYPLKNKLFYDLK